MCGRSLELGTRLKHIKTHWVTILKTIWASFAQLGILNSAVFLLQNIT